MMDARSLNGYDVFMSMTAGNYEESIIALRTAITSVMERRKISKAAMARTIRIERITLHNYLTGRRESKLEPLLMCAHVLGIDLTKGADGRISIVIKEQPKTAHPSTHPLVKQITRLMIINNLSDIDIAQRTGVQLRTIVRIINGTQMPDLHLLEAAFKIFGFSIVATKDK